MANRARTLLLCAAAGAACSSEVVNPVGPPPTTMPVEVQTARLGASAASTRFVTRDHFLASAEMQISGEPFAETMGRDLKSYSRDHIPTDVYFDNSPVANGPWIDLPGFSSGIESYEYSKQPMNMVAFESGAGTALGYAPIVNAGASGMAVTTNLAALVQRFAVGANTLDRFVFAPGTFPINSPRGGDPNPLGAGKPADNPLGWPGMWPTAHLFASFDPTIAPTSDIALGCAITSDDDFMGPNMGNALTVADYECNATTLHLVDRKAQVNFTITPGTDGASAWKYGLWVLNYLQVMHDSTEAPVASVGDADLANVGTPGNMIVGADDQGMATATGTFIGSSDIEGFQAQMFIAEVDNRAEDWLLHLTTADGQTLSGFSSLSDALAYDYTQPLRWFPGEIAVSESDDGSGFPKPSYAIHSANSHLVDLAALVLGYSEFYSLTDTRNAIVGGSQPVLAVFDGDPFPADDQKANGDPTLHDRALAMLRVAIVDLDRLHTDPGAGLLVDDVTMTGTTAARGTTIATTSVAWSILALRSALRSLGSELQLYSNNVTDAVIGSTPFDPIPIHPPTGTTLIGRMSGMLRAHADLLMTLSDPSGKTASGWDVSKRAPVDASDTLDAHAAAIRGLFAAFLATGDVRYRDRALAVFDRLQAVFYDSSARTYTAAPAPVDTVEWTPMRFALLQSALRDVYELVAARPGKEELEPLLEDRVGRLNKLVLNGWDDRNQNRVVDWPDECVRVVDRLPRGGLQLAERALTGEIGSNEENLKAGQPRSPTADREHDCVPEIDDARLPAALAQSITLQITRSK